MKDKVKNVLALGCFLLVVWGIWEFYKYDSFCMENPGYADCIEERHGIPIDYWGNEVKVVGAHENPNR